MQITNLTKKKKINCELAGTVWKQVAGLSFSKPKNMLFRFGTARKWEFWMFGMNYDIFMAFIDDEDRVFQLERAEKMTFNPATWRIYKPNKACRCVLETPEKAADVGDILEF